jgi:hypothetical protein
MTKTSIVTLAFTSLLLLGSVTETFAWTKSFNGTRDQVRAACGAGMQVQEFESATSCYNASNGNAVVCNDGGRCTGTGDGPMPRAIGQATGQVGQASGAVVEAQRTAFSGEIVTTVLKWKLKGKKKVVDAPMEGPTPDPQSGGSVLSGQGSDGGTGSGHIGNGNGVRLGVFQAM